ncbi:TetR/AcrR family transcriptional regulator [Saccharopolyspora rosea]|uniref:TetR/AcrR family transcriptional regulator n=1 Tax=Saccharopolyspora rosea TaxID=524884 RepID=A0ABW3FTU1_9PSEU|nr:TetR/AcrR family transcriptional regulator [Saccharopolyspora rosea]
MPTVDRRTRRTRRSLRDAFVALVLEHGYANVTVEDVTERADLGRATFYSHYTDKDALFSQVVSDLLAELHARLEPLVPASSAGFTGKPVLETFRHALAERDLYRIILRGEGDGRALRQFTDARVAAAAQVFQARADYHGVTPRIDIEVLARAWVGEQISVLRWWLEDEPPRLSPEQVTEMLLDLSLRGRYWANGFDGEPGERPEPGAAETAR